MNQLGWFLIHFGCPTFFPLIISLAIGSILLQGKVQSLVVLIGGWIYVIVTLCFSGVTSTYTLPLLVSQAPMVMVAIVVICILLIPVVEINYRSQTLPPKKYKNIPFTDDTRQLV